MLSVSIDTASVMLFRLGLPLLVIIAVILIANTPISPYILNGFGQENTASDLYKTKSIVLSPYIKHLVILIPNEGHESQNPGDVSSDQRLINQPYIPQSATVNAGTTVIWFNGDVDHDHKITLTNGANPENTIFDSGTFAYNEPSNPLVLNGTGTFNYYQTDVNNEDEDYVMNGTIIVSDQNPDANISSSTGIQGNPDTGGVLMVPARDLETYVQELKNNGFTIDSTEDFSDIRAGDRQVLLVWTTSGLDMNKVISTLQEITPNLPYS